ncbi:MAG: hypothetical protein R3Y43_01035 [Alphaproteobacteria bacterium]
MKKNEILRFLSRKTSFSFSVLEAMKLVNKKVEFNYWISILKELERKTKRKFIATGDCPFIYLKDDITVGDIASYLAEECALDKLLIYPNFDDEKLDFFKVKTLFMFNRICESDITLETKLIDLSLKGLSFAQPRDVIKIVEDKMKLKSEYILIDDYREMTVGDFVEIAYNLNITIKTLG